VKLSPHKKFSSSHMVTGCYVSRGGINIRRTRHKLCYSYITYHVTKKLPRQAAQFLVSTEKNGKNVKI